MLFIFFGAVGGTVIAFPLLASGKLQQKSIIPFGPLLILGAIMTRLFGVAVLNWYEHLLRFGS
jgi:prepilin signal peptidase PulO-like enzyme (type II secretory pathway)